MVFLDEVIEGESPQPAAAFVLSIRVCIAMEVQVTEVLAFLLYEIVVVELNGINIRQIVPCWVHQRHNFAVWHDGNDVLAVRALNLAFSTEQFPFGGELTELLSVELVVEDDLIARHEVEFLPLACCAVGHCGFSGLLSDLLFVCILIPGICILCRCSGFGFLCSALRAELTFLTLGTASGTGP